MTKPAFPKCDGLTPLEKVARAIHRADLPEYSWDSLPDQKIYLKLARAALGAIQTWQPMETAPTDRQILVRRHNDCFWEYFVVWYSDEDEHYPWRNDCTAYPTDRLDDWFEILDEECAALGEEG